MSNHNSNTNLASQPSFEHLCRICAANTKGKYSVTECVDILKTPMLRDKIEKFIYLSISESDLLPKVLCKQCFRQVEATSSLSKIAAHTQRVFRDFLITLREPDRLGFHYDTDHGTETAAPLALTTKENETRTLYRRDRTRTPPASSRPLPPLAHRGAHTLMPGPPPLTAAPHCSARKDEVIVNVSVADPLTRETQQKMISASQKQQSAMDARFTPKSIAQRAFTTSTPKLREHATTSASSATRKKQSPPGLINFFHGRAGQSQPQPPQQHSQQLHTQVQQLHSQPQQAHQPHHHHHHSHHQAQPAAHTHTHTHRHDPKTSQPSFTFLSDRQAQNSVSNIALNRSLKAPTSWVGQSASTTEVKRINLKNTLKSIKASKTGQVSLLKVSQRAPPELVTRSRTPLPPAQAVDEHAEELPEKIIIAAAKQKTTGRSASQNSAPLAESPMQAREADADDALTPRVTISEDIMLGRVIKDSDLLKLILNALKWPVSEHTLETQMSRLRNSNFTKIMSNPNLLADTDLTQIMGHVLHGMSVMLQQGFTEDAAASTSQAAAATATASGATTTSGATTITSVGTTAPSSEEEQLTQNLQTAEELANAIPYKLPAETSVQLVPAVPEEDDKSPPMLKRDARSCPKINPAKKMRKATPKKIRDPSIVISDEDDADEPTAMPNQRRVESKSTPNVAGIDTAYSSASGDSSSEALLALLHRQRAALERLQAAGQSPFETPAQASMRALGGANNNSQESGDVAAANSETSLQASSFPVPSQVSMPLVTRPNIKRRRTVIQASKAKTNLSIEKEISPPSNSVEQQEQEQLPPMPPLTKKPSVDDETDEDGQQTTTTQVPSGLVSQATQIPSHTKTDAEEPATVASKNIATSAISTAEVATSVTELPEPLAPPQLLQTAKTNIKRMAKSALGKQLLEAIGLQKAPGVGSSSSGAESSSSRESVHQIRTALKQSLKQAQEQQRQHQQRKQTEPVKRIADSTTTSKNSAAEVNVKDVNMKDLCSNDVLVNDIPVNDVPVNDVPVNDIPVNNVPVNDVRVNDVRVSDVRVNDVRDDDKAKKGALRVSETTVANAIRAMVKERTPPIQMTPARTRRSAIPMYKGSRRTPSFPPVAKKTDLPHVSEIDEPESDVAGNDTAAKSAGALTSTPTFVMESKPAVPADDISANSSNVSRKRGRKRKDDTPMALLNKEELAARAGSVPRKTALYDSSDDPESDDETPKNNEIAEFSLSRSSSRPTRVSKTLSKYYKGPDKQSPVTRPASTRLTRSRT